MTIEENKHLIQKLHEVVWNQGNLEAIEKYYAADFIAHYPTGDWTGHEGIRRSVRMMKGSFPDWHETVEDMVAAEDKVVSRFLSSGTHLGYMMDYPSTGRTVRVQEMAVFRIKDGKVAEQWGLIDLFGLLCQLGIETLPNSSEREGIEDK